MQDCSDVMQLLLKTQTDMKDLADDDPQVNNGSSSCCPFCKPTMPLLRRYSHNIKDITGISCSKLRICYDVVKLSSNRSNLSVCMMYNFVGIQRD